MSFRKLDFTVDVKPLDKALKKNNHLFGIYPNRAEAPESPHAEMTDIWIRYNDIKPCQESGDFSKFSDEHDAIWYDAYTDLPELKPIIFDLMRFVEGERLGGILITKLPPGGKIYPHIDGGWHAGYYDKYYVPVKNYPGAVFGFDDGIIRPKLGEVYWFDNSKNHWVLNDSDHDRIALIICIKHEGGL